MKERKKQILLRNRLYALLQGGYWMQYCLSLSYASFMMLDRGYSDAEIGVILAFGNIPAILLQRRISMIADRSKKVSLASLLMICYAVEAVAFSGELIQKTKGVGFTISMLVLMVISAGTQGLVNAMSHRLEDKDIPVNFGSGRAFGSLMYAVMSFIIGRASKSMNADVIPVAGFVICALLVALLLVISLKVNTASRVDHTEQAKKTGFVVFVKKYRAFFVLLSMCMFFYLSHAFINNFFFQIVADVGGNEADLGSILSICAVTELLPMFFYNRLERRFGTKKLLFASGFFFLVKCFITFVAPNVFVIYISSFFQMMSFAVFIPASVSYVSQVMDEEDAVRGQSMITMMICVVFFIASLLGGYLMEAHSVKTMLLVGVIAAAFGVAALGLLLVKGSGKTERN